MVLQAAGGAGMAGDKDQVVVFHAVVRPAQVMVDVGGLIVFVNAEEGDVEVVARDT